MNTVVLAVAAAAAVACPLHMLWQRRCGRGATCGTAPSREHDAAALRRRQRDLEVRIAELGPRDGDDDPSCVPAARG